MLKKAYCQANIAIPDGLNGSSCLKMLGERISPIMLGDIDACLKNLLGPFRAVVSNQDLLKHPLLLPSHELGIRYRSLPSWHGWIEPLLDNNGIARSRFKDIDIKEKDEEEKFYFRFNHPIAVAFEKKRGNPGHPNNKRVFVEVSG